MRALVLNCSLKPSSEPSNTDTLVATVTKALTERGVEIIDHIRVVDHNVKPGVETDMGDGDGWPAIHDKIRDADILIFATPTWVGKPSSVSQRVIERMDAMLSEKSDDGTFTAYNKVAGVVVTGNEDGAHHVISEISGGLIDIGFTIPGQSWTYWNRGPGPGPTIVDTDEGHEWSEATGRAMASNLVAVAKALAANPIPPVPE